MLAVFLNLLENEDDRQKFIWLYETNHSKMERIALHILQNQRDAEDAVQNAFIQIIRHFERVYEVPCEKLPFWCISIVKNEALTIHRKNQKVVLMDNCENVEVAVPTITDYTELVDLFARLPDTYRAVLEMKFILEYSSKEIGERLGLSEQAVNTRVSRGRALLKEIVEKEGFRA